MSALAPYPLQTVPQPLRTIAFGAVGASYTLVGSVFGAGICFLAIRSTFNADVTISLDGVNDWVVMGSTDDRLVVDLKTNGVPIPGYLGVYVKGVVASGNLYVTTLTALL